VLAVVLAVALAGCATLKRSPPPAVATEAGPVRVAFEEWDEGTQELLVRILPDAARPLLRWGHLQEPVRILVVNAHWELEERVGRPLPGISAWATRNQVLLHDPRWWPMPPSVENDPVLGAEVRRKLATQLLTHELTHCLMFQLAGPTPTEPRERIPFWFREGMATVTAGERPAVPRESLVRWMAEHPHLDPLAVRPGPPGDAQLASGAASHAFALLLTHAGEDGVLRILAGMRGGKGFSEAFEAVIPGGTAEFRQTFERSLGPGPGGGDAPTASPAAD
jgi:hypothetical protein